MTSRNKTHNIEIHLLGPYGTMSILRLYHSLCLKAWIGLKQQHLGKVANDLFKNLWRKWCKESQRKDERKCHISCYIENKRSVKIKRFHGFLLSWQDKTSASEYWGKWSKEPYCSVLYTVTLQKLTFQLLWGNKILNILMAT